MAGDALRSLFLEVGVDDKQAILALRNVTGAANLAEKALLGVANASKMTGGVTGAVSANMRLAQSYNALAVSAVRAGTAMRSSIYGGKVLDPAMAFANQVPLGMSVVKGGVSASQFQNMQWAAATSGNRKRLPQVSTYDVNPTSRGGAAIARGNYGLGTSLFLTAVGGRVAGYGFGQAANLQRSSLLSSYASGQSPGTMSAQSLGMTQGYRMRLSDSTSLTQEVAQLGSMTAGGAREIASAGAGFNVLESGVRAGDAAAGVYRLIKATSHSKAEFDAGTLAAQRYAGAIYAAGNESAAGAADVFAMTKELGPLSQFMNLGAAGTIALSATFADLNEAQRELFRGSLTRMASTGQLDPDNPIGSLLGIAARLRGATSDSQKSSILESLGFDNIRDRVTIAAISAGMDTFDRSLKAVNEELHGTSTFGKKVGEVLGTLDGQWKGLQANTDLAAAGIAGSLAPALGGLLAVLTGLAAVVAGNPALAMLLGIGGTVLAVNAAKGLYRHHLAGDAVATAARLGLSGPAGELRRVRYANMLANSLPMMPMGRAYGMAGSRFGMRMAQGLGMAAGAGAGRMSGLTLGLMKYLPFGGEMAAGAASRMAAGGLAGRAIGLATGPIGWLVTGLSLAAPLFSSLGDTLHDIGKQGGMLGVVFNTLGLVFDMMAAGGRMLNKAFGFIGDVGMGLLNVVTLGHGQDVMNGVNSFLGGAHDAISGIANDTPRAGAQSIPPRAPGVAVNIYTGGSQSGNQMAFDEVARRAARSMPAGNGGVPVA